MDKKTHCINGHLRTEQNTYTYPNGSINCRECRNAKQRDYVLRKSKDPLFKSKQRELQKSYRAQRPDRYAVDRNGWTLETYEAARISQNKCAICKRSPKEIGDGKRLSADHNHKTGKPRGLLCHHCNTGIGLLFDNVNRLEAAIQYLKGFE